MKKSKYQQYSHCFIVCILVPYAFWFSYQANIVTILISDTFRGTTLIRGRRLFQCGYSKVRRLLVWRLLEEMRYLNSPVKKQSLEVFCKSRCSQKFHKVRVSFFNKVAGFRQPSCISCSHLFMLVAQTFNFAKNDSMAGVFLLTCSKFFIPVFLEYLLATASGGNSK